MTGFIQVFPDCLCDFDIHTQLFRAEIIYRNDVLILVLMVSWIQTLVKSVSFLE